jgi:hypothetical protein
MMNKTWHLPLHHQIGWHGYLPSPGKRLGFITTFGLQFFKTDQGTLQSGKYS